MSVAGVIGRIEQILAYQSQLANPAAAAAAAGSAATGAPASTSAAAPGSFAAALTAAQGTGAPAAPDGVGDPATPVGLASSGVASGGVVSSRVISGGAAAGASARVAAMTRMADSLLGKPYVMGGGHAGWTASSGYDCSGFVSAVLHAGGYLTAPADTTALPHQPGIESGPGQSVTIYDRALPGQYGHVIIEINGQFYESGGSAGPWGGGGGVEKIGRPSAAYLATFPTVLHPAGL